MLRLLEARVRGDVLLVGGDRTHYEEFAYDSIVHVNNHYLKHRGKVDTIFHNGGSDCDPSKLLDGFILDQPLICVRFGSFYEKAFCDLYDPSWVEPYPAHIYRDKNPIGPEYEFCNIFAKRLGTVPFTGIFALHCLTLLPVTSIHVTGMTLYADENWKIPEKRDSHLVRPQLQYLKELRRIDVRVTYDEALTKVLDAN